MKVNFGKWNGVIVVVGVVLPCEQKGGNSSGGGSGGRGTNSVRACVRACVRPCVRACVRPLPTFRRPASREIRALSKHCSSSESRCSAQKNRTV